MKQRLMISIFGFVFFLVQTSSFSEPVNVNTARSAAMSKLARLNKADNYHVADKVNHFTDTKGKTLFYMFDLEPTGYMVISGDSDLPPVIAYSLTGDAGSPDDESNVFISLLKADLSNRLENINLLSPDAVDKNNDDWISLTDGVATKNGSVKFEQWPPAGTTPTGGWLESNWHQSPPYNNFCPMDPVTNQRSVAGCPATAMAMILNYYENINGTFFTDEDDYHHAYAGRNYWIDDDHVEIDFPSFPVLDAYLDTISQCYVNGDLLKDSEKAALTFACGVAAHQVYTSQVSGTFGVNQALQAYQRFGFYEVTFFDQYDTSIYATLAQNMMEGRPAHLAVVDPGWTMGHNVVVDGYNTDDYFHLNFGWGGSYNGWYLLPEQIPYGLTVIEGAIADISYPPVTSAMNELTDANFFEISPNPATERINIGFSLPKASEIHLDIFGLHGSLLFSETDRLESGNHTITVDLNGLDTGGMVLCRLSAGDRQYTKRIVIR